MENKNMTPTPWHSSDHGAIHDTDHNLIATLYSDRMIPDSRAILSAINGTYGKGIDPSAVEGLQKIAIYLIEISEYKSFSMHHFLPVFKAAKAAMEKAQIK